ncbi:hypothetical protein EV702DRAFT_1198304 [Suillus placidus]|uniref:Uncharacterized protein n=1 Tax=Suillus placidus TaxID=48579 RepID=A0A9P7D1Q8_9AGAM|nr:hypothetical protein EV702DRAFT_1198304 [Suillus placidus]
MSHPSNRPYHSKVRFETPMETNESTFSSEAGTPVNVSRPRFNLGISIPVAQPLPAPRFDFGMDLDLPVAPPPAAPPTPKFNFSMNLSIPVAVPPASPAVHTQQPFNLGFTLAQPTQQPAPMPFNLGFNLPVQGTPPPPTPPPTASQPFNLGFNLPKAVPHATAETSPPTASQPFNLGFNLPMAVAHVTAETSRHVGYDTNNRSFQFGCEPPAPIGEWQPELIRAPQSAPRVASPPAIINAAPGPSMPGPLPDTAGHQERPTLTSLVGDAKRAAIDIVYHLGGEEFDHLAHMMVGGALGPGDDIWDPNPDEVLESNKMMLMAFCEGRDRLTRIFKDLISLHHLAQVHERVLPAVESLLYEVGWAEAGSSEEM